MNVKEPRDTVVSRPVPIRKLNTIKYSSGVSTIVRACCIQREGYNRCGWRGFTLETSANRETLHFDTSSTQRRTYSITVVENSNTVLQFSATVALVFLHDPATSFMYIYCMC